VNLNKKPDLALERVSAVWVLVFVLVELSVDEPDFHAGDGGPNRAHTAIWNQCLGFDFHAGDGGPNRARTAIRVQSVSAYDFSAYDSGFRV